MDNSWFTQSFTINTAISTDYHKEIQEFIDFFVEDYKWAVESGYAYLNALPVIQKLGAISQQLPDNTHAQYVIIMETIGPYLMGLSGRHLILTVAKLLESPKGRHEHENRSFNNIYSLGHNQGYVSDKSKQAFQDIRKSNKALIEKVQGYRDSIAHSVSGENLIEPAFAQELINFLENEIRNLYNQLMREWCPERHAAIRRYGEEAQLESDIVPRNINPDLEILGKIHSEKLELLKAARGMIANQSEDYELLKERARLLYQDLFGIQILKRHE